MFKKKESRNDERFYPKDSTYVVFSPGFVKRGPMINISRGGLGCLYFIDKTARDWQIDQYINIRCGTFTIGNIPFKIVSDKLLSDEQHGGHRIIRKRSIGFFGLSQYQKEQIDYFIFNYTKKSLTDYKTNTDGFKLPFM